MLFRSGVTLALVLMFAIPLLNALYFALLLNKGERAYRFGQTTSILCTILTVLFITLVIICNDVIKSESYGLVGDFFELKSIPYVLLGLSVINIVILRGVPKADNTRLYNISIGRAAFIIVGYTLLHIMLINFIYFSFRIGDVSVYFICRVFILCASFLIIYTRKSKVVAWLSVLCAQIIQIFVNLFKYHGLFGVHPLISLLIYTVMLAALTLIKKRNLLTFAMMGGVFCLPPVLLSLINTAAGQSLNTILPYIVSLFFSYFISGMLTGCVTYSIVKKMDSRAHLK